MAVKNFWIEFTDGSPDQATAYQKEKMKKEMSKRMSGNVNSVIHKHEHSNTYTIMHIIYLIYIYPNIAFPIQF